MDSNPEKKLVLVIDDDWQLNKMLTYLFMSLGINVETAINGVKALELLKEINPDAIILDLMMPDMDGFEFCEIIKGDSNLKDIPVIVLSALLQAKHEERIMSLGAIDYVSKPFKSSEFVKKVRDIIENHNK